MSKKIIEKCNIIVLIALIVVGSVCILGIGYVFSNYTQTIPIIEIECEREKK